MSRDNEKKGKTMTEIPLSLSDCYIAFASRPINSLRVIEPVIVSSSNHADHIRKAHSGWIIIIHPRMRYIYKEMDDLPLAIKDEINSVVSGPDLEFVDSGEFEDTEHIYSADGNDEKNERIGGLSEYSYLMTDLTIFDTVLVSVGKMKEIIREGKSLRFFPGRAILGPVVGSLVGPVIVFTIDMWSETEQRLLTGEDF
jgi:hypothetical protein